MKTTVEKWFVPYLLSCQLQVQLHLHPLGSAKATIHFAAGQACGSGLLLSHQDPVTSAWASEEGLSIFG